MKKVFYLIVFVFLYTSCSKDDSIVLSSKLALKEIIIENNQIKLEWNRPYINNFSYYAVYKTSEPLTSGNYYYGSIAQISNIDSTIFFDVWSLEENIYYTVLAYNSSNVPLVSNSQQLNQSDLVIFNSYPNDVVHYPKGNRLFLFMDNKVYSCDYESMEITDSIVLGSFDNYGSLGSYNGNDELYVACSNGFVRIYDINTLSELAYISIGSNVQSVVADDNGNMFIKSYMNWDWELFSYRRSTLNQTDIYSGWYGGDRGRIKHLNNSNTIIEIPINSSSKIIYYDHDNEGNFINAFESNNYSYPKNSEIFEIFSNSDYIITDKSGAIYSSDLDFVRQLGDSYYDYYNDFCIDDYIYGASAVEKEIKLFSKSSYSMVKRNPTSLYPLLVYKDNNELIIFGSDTEQYMYYSKSKFSIEKITLN